MDATMVHIRKHTGREENNPGDGHRKGTSEKGCIYDKTRFFFLSKFVATSKVSSVINQPATLQADLILQTHFRFTNNDREVSQPSNPVFLCILWHHSHNLPLSTPYVHTTLGLFNRFSMCTKTRHGP